MHKCSKLQMSDSTVRRIYILHCALTSYGQDLITFALDHCIYFKDMRGISRVLPRRLRLLRLRYSGSGFPLQPSFCWEHFFWGGCTGDKFLVPFMRELLRGTLISVGFAGCGVPVHGLLCPGFPASPFPGSPTPKHSPSRHHLLLCGERLSPAAFAVFSLSLVLSSLIMIFAGLDFFGFIFFGAH